MSKAVPEVKRYNITIDKYYHPVPYETEHGMWVKYRSYKDLQAECEELLEALQGALLWVDGSTKVKVRAAIAKATGEAQ